MSLVLRVSSSITEAQVGKMKKKRLEEENREDKERKKSKKYVTHRKVSMKYISAKLPRDMEWATQEMQLVDIWEGDSRNNREERDF